jgi:type IX secretion system PorP/SprF family membrane protein
MNLKALTCLILLTIFLRPSISQDIHYSNFTASPLYLNPANTGNFVGDWRVSGIYRNQWRAIGIPFQTSSVSFDKQFYVYGQNVSGGLFFISDESGKVGLNVNKIYLSGAYYRNINNNDVRVGFQVGYVFKSFNYDEMTFPSQFDMGTGYYNNTLSNYEDNVGDRTTYLDVNLGAVWRKKIGFLEPEVGLAIYHLNKPNESFISNSKNLPMRNVVHTGVMIDITEEIYIKPKALYMSHFKATDLIVGSDMGFRIIGKKTNVREVFGGLYVRDGFGQSVNSLAAIAGVTVGRLDVGLTYDFNMTSADAMPTTQGAFEITLIYKSISTVLNSYSIPCERF